MVNDGISREATVSRASERDRILAAVGWETDPRRCRVVRDLLWSQIRRVYFHSYARIGRRAPSIEVSKRVLLRAARTLGQVPEGSSLTAWIYLLLAEESGLGAECPEVWRLLVEVEEETDRAADRVPDRPGARAAGAGPRAEEQARHLETHPACRKLVEEFGPYLHPPQDEETLTRSGWSQASRALEGYLQAQFADERTDEAGLRSRRHPHVSLRWKPSRAVAFAFALAAFVFAVLLFRAWGSRRPAAETTAVSENARVRVPAARRPARADHHLEPIPGANLRDEPGQMVISWSPPRDIDEFHVLVLSPKLDTLFAAPAMSRTGTRIGHEEVSGASSGMSLLYQVDGARDGKLVASTGPVPFKLR